MSSERFALFASMFRRELYEHLEYSASEKPDAIGTMIAGSQSAFARRVLEYSSTIPFAKSWTTATERLLRLIAPITYLFRVDWRQMVPSGLSLYWQLPCPLPDEELSRILVLAGFDEWKGPSPNELAKALDTQGITGLNVRVNESGKFGVGVYYLVHMHVGQFQMRGLKQLIEQCQFPPSIHPVLLMDIARVFQAGMMGVIGIDPGQDGAAAAVKLNAPNVPLRIALAFIQRKEASHSRIHAITALSNDCRMSHVSYIGIKYSSAGFRGWKVYWSTLPRALSPAFGAKLLTNQRTILIRPKYSEVSLH
jgi:hypothetical protein